MRRPARRRRSRKLRQLPVEGVEDMRARAPFGVIAEAANADVGVWRDRAPSAMPTGACAARPRSPAHAGAGGRGCEAGLMPHTIILLHPYEYPHARTSLHAAEPMR